jgi:hypothetical protein
MKARNNMGDLIVTILGFAAFAAFAYWMVKG